MKVEGEAEGEAEGEEGGADWRESKMSAICACV